MEPTTNGLMVTTNGIQSCFSWMYHLVASNVAGKCPVDSPFFVLHSKKFIVQKSWRIFKPRFDISKNRLFVSLCQNGWATKICQERTGIDHESRRIKMTPCVLGASFYLILGWHPSLAHTMFSLSHLWADYRRYGISSPFATKIDTYIIHILEDLLVSRFWRCAFHHQTYGTR